MARSRAASRGLRVAALDKGDLASGTGVVTRAEGVIASVDGVIADVIPPTASIGR